MITATDATSLPPPVALLRAFANTIDYEDGTEVLTDPEALTRWLGEHELLDRPSQADTDDLTLALALRTELRAAMAAHHDNSPHPPSHDEAIASALPLRLSLAGAEPRLEPLATGARGALTKILIAVEESRLEGRWDRLKVCPADDCRWAFYDASKNRARTWCSMGVCGNRTKTRAYRARRRAAESPSQASD